MEIQSPLSGRQAIVTGGSQGLGREIARHFLAAGADVAFCARTQVDVATALADLQTQYPDRRIFAQTCDIGRIEDIDRFYKAVVAAFGDIDVVVNNAGVHGPIGAIETVNWGEWAQAVAINLLGTVFSCRTAIAHFKARPGEQRGKIINLSGGGATAPQAGLTAYGASKAAVVRFTETLAEEVRAFPIDVNAVAPGALATRLMTELKSAGPERIGTKYHTQVEQQLTGGGMSISRAAELCVYLASPASDGLTGRLISAAWDPWPFDTDQVSDVMSSDIYTLRRIVPADRDRKWGDTT